MAKPKTQAVTEEAKTPNPESAPETAPEQMESEAPAQETEQAVEAAKEAEPAPATASKDEPQLHKKAGIHSADVKAELQHNAKEALEELHEMIEQAERKRHAIAELTRDEIQFVKDQYPRSLKYPLSDGEVEKVILICKKL